MSTSTTRRPFNYYPLIGNIFCLLFIISYARFVSASEDLDFENNIPIENEILDDPIPIQNEKIGALKLSKNEDAHTNFMSAFIASISVILVSEIGDKTFFIAAIMSAQHSRLTVFAGAMTALAIMTAMSAAMGNFTTTFIKVEYTRIISNVLFVLFGLRSLREGIKMKSDEDSEFKETDAELKEAQADQEREKLLGNSSNDPEMGVSSSRSKNSAHKLPWYQQLLRTCLSRIYLQAFTMTFLAEWGDRSQITTIILGTTDDPFGVTAGGCLGHFICTGFACLGGRMIAQKISVKNITLLGGVVFILFAIHGFYQIFREGGITFGQ